jgi:hypothetical protein
MPASPAFRRLLSSRVNSGIEPHQCIKWVRHAGKQVAAPDPADNDVSTPSERLKRYLHGNVRFSVPRAMGLDKHITGSGYAIPRIGGNKHLSRAPFGLALCGCHALRPGVVNNRNPWVRCPGCYRTACKQQTEGSNRAHGSSLKRASIATLPMALQSQARG